MGAQATKKLDILNSLPIEWAVATYQLDLVIPTTKFGVSKLIDTADPETDVWDVGANLNYLEEASNIWISFEPSSRINLS